MNWTQPICLDCYAKRYPGRQPATIKDADRERCCDCGNDTLDGIYFRVDPRTTPFPSE